jgi:hypothetical protein
MHPYCRTSALMCLNEMMGLCVFAASSTPDDPVSGTSPRVRLSWSPTYHPGDGSVYSAGPRCADTTVSASGDPVAGVFVSGAVLGSFAHASLL